MICVIDFLYHNFRKMTKCLRTTQHRLRGDFIVYHCFENISFSNGLIWSMSMKQIYHSNNQISAFYSPFK